LAQDSAVRLDGDRSDLTTAEQAARLARIVERIDYDGREGELAIRLARGNREETA
jgi:hypothetical protein